MFQKRVLPVMVALAASGAMTTHAQQELLEEIVVQGVRSAELNAREMERQKNIFSSVISQDDAGNFADQNVAEALQRLPGVTLTKSDGQGEFVNVRGMGAGFVGVSMNNSEMASASGDGRAVGLNTIPADLMGSIEVFKSLTPDMDLNSIAGRVNVNSVSAFDRGHDSLRMTVQGAQHEQRGQFSPKITLIGTKLLADDTVGVALSVSHEERGTEVNQIFNEGGLRYIRASQPGMGPGYAGNQYSARDRSDAYFYEFESSLGADTYYNSTRMLTPNNFEVRQDESERTRTAATLNLGWRPTSNSEYFLRLSRTDYTDEELTLREYFRLGAGDSRYIAYVDDDYQSLLNILQEDPVFNAAYYGLPESGTHLFGLSGADLEHRVFIQKAKDENTTITLGGENIFADIWTLDYEYHNSKSDRKNPDDRRVQFRKRSLPMVAQLGKDDITAKIVSASTLEALARYKGTVFPNSGIPGTNGQSGQANVRYAVGERYQPGMAYDNLFLESGSRSDSVEQFKVNLQWSGETGFVNYVKGGILVKSRERTRERLSWSLNPQDYVWACRGDENCIDTSGKLYHELDALEGFGFETYTPRNDRFDHDFMTIKNAEALIAATRLIPENLDPNAMGAASNAQNYDVYEDSQEAYLMAEFQLADSISLIAGARYVRTEYGSNGYLTMRHDRFSGELDPILRDIVIPLTDAGGGNYVTTEYDGIYPGAHLRWDINDQLLFRSAIWSSYTRPSFGQAAARAEFSGRVKLCADQPLAGRAPCSDNLVGDLGAPTTVGDGTNGYLHFLATQTSLAPGGNDLRLGNTDLVAMEAINFDASLSWYGDGGHFAEVAIFYKDIKDYVVEVRGASRARESLPENVRNALDQIDSTGANGHTPGSLTENIFKIDSDFIFHNVTTAENGDKAHVYGVELSYSHFFDRGFFLTSNLTLLNSRADAGESIRAEKTKMPNQADVTTNLTLGWENDMFSARLIGNYRSKIMTQIGTCSQADINRDLEWAMVNDLGYDGGALRADGTEILPLANRTGNGDVYPEYCQRWADVFHDATFNLDFKATYNLNSNIKFYADIMNITEDVDVFYYRGNEYSHGNVLYKSEGLGRTYQLGVNVRFW